MREGCAYVSPFDMKLTPTFQKFTLNTSFTQRCYKIKGVIMIKFIVIHKNIQKEGKDPFDFFSFKLDLGYSRYYLQLKMEEIANILDVKASDLLKLPIDVETDVTDKLLKKEGK